MKTRREFFQWVLVLAGGLGASKLNWAFGAEAPLPAGKTAVPKGDKAAESLGYVADASKVDLKKYPQKKTPEGKKQLCDNCMFYTKENDSWGKCQVIQSGLVNGKGWCMSWAKKA